MGESRPMDIGKLEETLNGLSVAFTQEKPIKGKLQALHSVISSLRQYADLGAFQLTQSDSVSQYLTSVFHSLPAQLLALLPSASQKQQLIGLQLCSQLFQIASVLSSATAPILTAILNAWRTSPSLFESGKKALLTQYQDLALDFTIELYQCVENSDYDANLHMLLKTWPAAKQIQEQVLVKTAGKSRKRGRVSRMDNFDPLLEGGRKEVDEEGFEFRYGEELGKAWAAFVGKELPREVVEEVLEELEQVLTRVSSPLLFSDFLLVLSPQSLFSGSDRSLCILSLPPLLHLITRHGLECKRFYPRLYALFRKEIASGACPREQLRLLLERALGSPLLPASLPASFMKVRELNRLD